jgi:glycosyltransferase involved in cell wall biosynthesis
VPPNSRSEVGYIAAADNLSWPEIGLEHAMTDRADISVVMPVYNGASFLERALRSLTVQTMPHWELLAVDDASTDDSFDRLSHAAQADPRIRPARLEINQGPSAARNHALRQARGDIIAYLDQDDELYPEQLQRIVARMDWWDVLVFAYDLVYPPGVVGGSEQVFTWDPAPVRDRILEQHIAVPLGVAHRRELLDRVGLFNEHEYVEHDSDQWRRFARAGAYFLFLPDKSGRYHVRADSQARVRRIPDAARPPGIPMRDDDQRLRFPADVDGWLSVAEGTTLARLARDKLVIEVGSWCGKSTICLAQTARVVHAVDWFQGDRHAGRRWTLADFQANLDRYGVSAKVVVHPGRFEDVALSFAGCKFELLFLDAEHDIVSVRRHIRLLRQLAATDAVFAFHDYHQPLHPAVRQAVDEAFPGWSLSCVDSLAVLRRL